VADAPLRGSASPGPASASESGAPETSPAHAAPGTVPFEIRLAGLLPLPPFATGALLALALCVGTVALQAAFGALWSPSADPADDLFARLDSGVRASVVLSLLVGYTVAAARWVPLAITRDLAEAGLRPPPPADDPEAPLRYPPAALRRSRWTGALGAAVGAVVELLALGVTERSTGGSVGWGDPGVWTTGALTPLLGFLMARAGFSTVLGSEPPRHGPEPVDLLDLRPQRVRARVGLRLALVWIAGSSIASLFFLDPDLAAPLAPLVGGGLAVGGLALFLQTRGTQPAIRRAKRAELARIEPELRAAREAALRGDVQGRGRLADLLVWRSYVESIREWPFDGTLLVRFGLYVLIPLGSWLGGALVERALSALLD